MPGLPGGAYPGQVLFPLAPSSTGITLVANTNGITGANGASTPTIDTTGATLLIISVAFYAGSTTSLLVEDPGKNNTWTPLTLRNTATTGERLYYCANPAHVGPGHYASVTAVGIYPVVSFFAFSGTDPVPFVAENGATSTSGSSLASGSVTPLIDGSLVFSGWAGMNGNSTPTVGSGLTRAFFQNPVAGSCIAGSAGYLIQTTAAAINPTWSWTGTDHAAAAVAVFKPVVVTPTTSAQLSQLPLEVLHQIDASAVALRLSQLPIEVLWHSAVPTGSFENATITTGLTYMRLRTRSGVDYYWSDRPLPDPQNYEGGWKGPRVIEWGKLKRALSGFNGQYETTDVVVTLDDTDRLLRDLDRQGELVNAGVLIKMLPDDQRRLLVPWTTVYHGIVREGAPTGTLLYDLTIKDPFAERFAREANPVPERVVTVDDFPNCTVDLVASSAVGYVTGSAAIGATSIPVSGGSGSFANDDQVTFAGDLTIYRVTAETFDDPETSMEITPALVAGVSGAAVTVRPSHTIEPAVGRRVPFWYGHLTDQHLDGTGYDAGDGQAPLIYVGDRTLSDGKTYGEFLWAGHACYSPSGKPIPALYFWNENLNDLQHHALLDPMMGGIDTEAASGGRLALPGWSNWTTLGYSTPYVDYHGRRYTVIFMRGIFRDWALGLHGPPPYLGGVPFAAEAYGCETVGNGTGTLILDAFAQYLHILQNWTPPRGHAYQSGAWASTLTFSDDPTVPMINEASFTRAQTQSVLYTMAFGESRGFRGDFGVGITTKGADEPVTVRDLLARLNVSFGVDAGFSKTGQFFISMLVRDPASLVFARPLTWERDVFAGTFSIEAATRDLYTSLEYRHTRDYFNRSRDGWQSLKAGLETSDSGAIALYGADTTFSTVALHLLRGKNRDIDPDEYLRGTATVACVLALKLARSAWVQHLPKFQTGPAGFDYELGETLKLTHYEGLSATGWTDRPVRVERIEVDPKSYTTTLETYDLDPILE